jgi:hypothetical protein
MPGERTRLPGNRTHYNPSMRVQKGLCDFPVIIVLTAGYSQH